MKKVIKNICDFHHIIKTENRLNTFLNQYNFIKNIYITTHRKIKKRKTFKRKEITKLCEILENTSQRKKIIT